MRIIKVYPYQYPVHFLQNSSIFLASKPYVDGSIHDIKILSSFTVNKISSENIIYVGDENKNITYDYYLKEITKLINELSPDLIEVEMDLKFASDIALNVRNIPVVIICHLNLIKSSFFENIKRFFQIRNVSHFIFVSHYFKNKFLKYYPYLKNKVYVIHNSSNHISKELISDLTKENQIIFLGRGTIRKGVREYLEGVSKFLAINKDWKALFVGFLDKQRDIDFLEKIFKKPEVDSLIKEGRLKILTNITNSEAFNLLKKSKISVFPTIPRKHQEGIPLVALEACLAKCLMISSTSGGYPEINPFKETIIKKVSSNSILEKLNYFCNNDEKIKEFSKKQHEFMKENFTYDNLMKQFDETRKDILKKYRK